MTTTRVAMWTATLIGLILAFALVGCPRPTPPPVPIGPGGATCASVCARYVALGCPEGQATAKGATCAEVCLNVQNSGILDLGLDCRQTAATCAAARLCGL